MEFQGERSHVAIAQVDRVERARQSCNWIAYLLANVALSPVYFLLYLAVRHFRIAGEYLGLAILVVNVAGFAIGRSVTWVVVVGRDGAGKPVRAWFAAGARQGWAGIFGLTRQLYEDMLHQLQSGAHRPPNTPAAADGARGGG